MYVARVSSVVYQLLCVAVIIVIVQARIVTARDEEFVGNVRFMAGGKPSNNEGVLQIFLPKPSGWTLLCYNYEGKMVTNSGAAATACRQKEKLTAANWNTSIFLNYRDSKDVDLSQAITGIRCPNVECVNDDGTFLLRCDYDVHDQLVGKGSCNGFVAVQCDRRQLTAYNGKVSIIQNDDSQTELLGIMLEGETLPICSSYHLSDAATDSACRQMGFTHGRVITQPPNKGKSWKIHDLSKCDTSLPCFTDCIDQSLGYTLVDQCDEHQYELICQFNKSTDVVFSAGNQYICVYPSASTDIALVAVSLLLTAIIIGMFILLLCLCCWPLKRLKLDEGANQPCNLFAVLRRRRYKQCCCNNNLVPEQKPLLRNDN